MHWKITAKCHQFIELNTFICAKIFISISFPTYLSSCKTVKQNCIFYILSWPKNQPSFFPIIKKPIIKSMEICVNACLKKIIIYASTWLGNIFWKLARKCITDFYVRKKQRKVNIFTFS